ncbi:MAG TPA: alpha/beta hydrolase [Candidatus Paceibacterota bacterium]|nr:alpha/beta hydrolase [Candidatus Paceibacterota bacterium]
MEKFEIKNRKGLKIVGELYRPENPIGLVFVQHGLGSYKEQVAIVATVDIFLKNNYIVINFDSTNSVGESEGKFEDATMQLHYEDLVDVIEWSKSQSWYKEPFVLTGSSLGGYSVVQYAEEYSSLVKAIVAKAPVISGELSFKTYEKFNPEVLKNWKETGWDERKSVSKPGLIKRLPWSHMEERLNHDLRPNALKLTMPILIVVGENDTSCPLDVQETLFNLLPKNIKNELYVIKGAPHTFREKDHIDEFKNKLDNWLKKLK